MGGGVNIKRIFAKYVSLNIIGMLGLSLYILADTFFVARGIGADGLTALNLAIPIYSFLNGIGLMIGMGGATRFSISKSKDVFTQSVYYVIIAACVFWTLGVFSKPISCLMGADSQTLEYTSVYLRTFLSFSPMFLFNNCIICFVRNDGNPKLPMIAMLIGSCANIVFDYIFIFPCQMGMFGAALATGFAPVISILMLSSHFIRRKNTFSFIKQRINLKSLADISSLGISSLITEFSSGIVMIVFNISLLNIAGNTGVAAYGIIANIALVVIAVFNGISQGIQPIISASYGCGREGVVKSVLIYGIITSVIIALVVCVISFIFAEPITAVFNRDGDIKLAEMAENGLKIYFTSFMVMGVNILCATFFSSVDNPKNAFVISALRGFVIIIPVVFILAAMFGINGIWLSVTVTEIIVLMFVVTMMCRNKNI